MNKDEKILFLVGALNEISGLLDRAFDAPGYDNIDELRDLEMFVKYCNDEIKD